MRFSLSWLAEYCDLSGMKVSEISDALTQAGLEVEAIESSGPFTDAVIVGEVMQAEKHPQADTLRVCQVKVSETQSLEIVCGAPNARAGIRVAVAQIGCTLPGNFLIKESKIRGVTSNGMLCSARELGLGEEHDGIIELDKSAPLGSPVVQVLGLGDTILTLNITPNRGDCLGVMGIARDLAAKVGRRFTDKHCWNLGTDTSVPRDGGVCPNTGDHVSVSIADPSACGRFLALKISPVKAVAAPAWLKKKIESSGMRSVNAIVDCANLVMLTFNQPVHTYDVRGVSGNQLICRRAKAGEKLRTLDGEQRDLVADDLVIADSEKILGIAGVMGSFDSEIKDDTREIILEVAHFVPSVVRRTAKRFGLKTEASYRYERGCDIENLKVVAENFTALLAHVLKECGQSDELRVSPLTDMYPEKRDVQLITVQMDVLKQHLGLPSLSVEDASNRLAPLGIKVVDQRGERVVYSIPSWRTDLERSCDLVEEVGRMIGYDKIPTTLPHLDLSAQHEHPVLQFADSVRTALAVQGFSETVSFPFCELRDFERLQIAKDHAFYPRVYLKNPINAQESALTTTLQIGLLKALTRNSTPVKLFEVGRGYFDFSKERFDFKRFKSWASLTRKTGFFSENSWKDQGRVLERLWVAGVISNPVQEKTWETPADVAADFYSAKKVVTNLLKSLGITSFSFARITPEEAPWLHPGKAASLLIKGKLAGTLGVLHPVAQKQFDLTNAPVLFECDVEGLCDGVTSLTRAAENIQPFPGSSRDVAWVVDAKTMHSDIEALVQSFTQKQYLSQFNLFDIYAGQHIPEGKKSMAYRFEFQSPERTLRDQEVDQEFNALLSWAKEKVGAERR